MAYIMNLEELKTFGESFGLSGTELSEFIKEQQAETRNVMASKREIEALDREIAEKEKTDYTK